MKKIGKYRTLSTIIYEGIEFNVPYSSDDLLNICNSNNLKVNKQDIYNVVHIMKEQGLLTHDKNKKYIKSSPGVSKNMLAIQKIQESITSIKDFLTTYENFDWINSPEEELLSTRAIIKELKRLATKIEAAF